MPGKLATTITALLLAAGAAGCGSGTDGAGVNPTTSPSPGATAGPAVTCEYTEEGNAAKAVRLPPEKTDPNAPRQVVITTNAGPVPVTLEPETAPCAVHSFLWLANQGYFDDTPCHRLSTKGYYVLQCGDPSGTGSGGPGYYFDDELVPNDPRLQPCQPEACTYSSGLLAMANSSPNANGSQFFLVYGASLFPPDYVVLGHMNASGLKTVKEIAAAGIGKEVLGPGDGTPKKPVEIQSVG